jgi:hypothetical protein
MHSHFKKAKHRSLNGFVSSRVIPSLKCECTILFMKSTKSHNKLELYLNAPKLRRIEKVGIAPWTLSYFPPHPHPMKNSAILFFRAHRRRLAGSPSIPRSTAAGVASLAATDGDAPKRGAVVVQVRQAVPLLCSVLAFLISRSGF